MPYIAKGRRIHLNDGSNPLTEGELNYVLTKICQKYLGEAPNYALFNDVIGALECCKLELYRRMVAPYENKKIEENGDVY